MFNFNMFNMSETYDAVFEVYIEDKLVNKQSMQAPKEMLMMNFVQTMEQLGKDRRPMRISMLVPISIWDRFENVQKILNNKVEFSNNAMIAWEENNKGGVDSEGAER